MKQMLRWALLAVTLTAGGRRNRLGGGGEGRRRRLLGGRHSRGHRAFRVVGDLRSAVRRFGVDVLAVLSLVGALAVREYLAGALIAVMLATGQALDAAAERRATKDLRALLDRVPRTARRRSGDDIEVVELDAIVIDDVLVGPGEVLPVDGLVHSDYAVIDDSALTGEPLQVRYGHGDAVRSGAVNAGGGMEMDTRASATAADSTYGGSSDWPGRPRRIRTTDPHRRPSRRLVRPVGAGRRRPGMVAQRVGRTGGGGTGGGHPVPATAGRTGGDRGGGVIPRASRIGVLVRGGGPLETLGKATTLVLDKTGTLTSGRPRGTDVVVAPGWTIDEVLGLAASADQLSPHVLAAAIVAEAKTRGLSLVVPDSVEGGGRHRGRGDHRGTAGARRQSRYRIVRRGTRRVGRVGVVPGRPGRSRGGLGAGRR